MTGLQWARRWLSELGAPLLHVPRAATMQGGSPSRTDRPSLGPPRREKGAASAGLEKRA